MSHLLSLVRQYRHLSDRIYSNKS